MKNIIIPNLYDKINEFTINSKNNTFVTAKTY
jgi:hypothetical protein